jgi:hypothetical protein
LEFSNFEKHSSTTSPTSTTARSVAAEAPTDVNEVKLEIDIQSESSNDPSTPNTVKSVPNPNKTDSESSFVTPTQGTPLKQDKNTVLAKEEPSRPDSKNEQNVDYKSSIDEIKDLIKSLWHSLEPLIDLLLEVVWRLLEIHLIKVILFCAVLIAIADVWVLLFLQISSFKQFNNVLNIISILLDFSDEYSICNTSSSRDAIHSIRRHNIPFTWIMGWNFNITQNVISITCRTGYRMAYKLYRKSRNLLLKTKSHD